MNQTSIYNFTVNTSSTTTTTSTGGGGTSSSDEADDTLKTPSIKAPKKNPEYTVTPSDGFKLELKQTESGQVSFKISNSGAKQISFFIKVNDLGTIDYSLSENNFTLEIGDSRVVTIDVPTTKYTPIGIYYGKINVFTSYDDVEIPLVVIINPYENLFDLNITIPREFKEVLPGNVVKANLTLSNLKDIEDRNFTMYYAITDFYGNVIDSRYEEINFNTRTVTFEKEFDIPEKTERGNYLFISRGLSNNNEVFDADDFTIGEEFDAWSIITSNMIFILILISALIVAFLMVRYHKAKEKTRLLNLYLMITELDKLVKEGKFDQAVDIFVRIKSAYHEPVSQTLLKNKEALKIEMEKLANDLDINVIQKIEARNKKDDEKDKKADSKKTDDEKKSQETKVIKNDDAPKKETEKSVNPEQKAIVKKEDVTQEGKTPEQKKALLEKDPGEKRGALLEKYPGEKMRDPGEKFKTQKKEIISQTVKQSINKKTESSDEKKTDSTKKERSPVKKRIVHKLNKIKSKKKL